MNRTAVTRILIIDCRRFGSGAKVFVERGDKRKSYATYPRLRFSCNAEGISNASIERCKRAGAIVGWVD